MKYNKTLVSTAVSMLLSCTINASVVYAQDVENDQKPLPPSAQSAVVEDQETEKISILGSRRTTNRSLLDVASPVEIISAKDLVRQGDTNAIDAMTSVIPSLNANREPISDAATLVRPINLRSLASDHTLVLVNGKRRHRGAVVGELVSGVNRGAQGVDVAPLFGASLKQIEVLRDGAAAQYGADAIAGVINFTLEDDPNARSITAQYGEAYEGDGETIEVSGTLGFHLGDDGFGVLSFQIKDAEPTSRGIQDGEGTNSGATALAVAGFPVENPVVVWGAPEVKNDYKVILNAGISLSDSTELYTFGNYATRDVDGSFYYRNPSNRSGVFTNNGNVLFADSTGAGCPIGALPTSSFADAQAFINSAPENCFAFQSRFPGGFTPRFGGNVKDHSLAVGLRGEIGRDMTFDVSVMQGTNNLQYKMFNSANASLGEASPLDFDLGAQIEKETVVNADFSSGYDMGILESDLNVAFGFQYHDESFEITPGQEESYIAGPFADQGFSVGSNGFQGFSPSVSGEFSRNSISAYVDLEADLTESLLLSTAIRYEDFSDFGDTVNGKISARYRINDIFAVRGAVSTGFRAPSVGQSNLQRAATNFNNGELEELLVVSSTSAFAAQFGGEQLEAEDARNLSLGLTADFDGFEFTIDLFNIEIENRIAQVTRQLDQNDRDTLVAAGVTEAGTVSQVSFFVNDFDTETRGVDIVASYPISWPSSTTKVTLAMNYTDTEVTKRGQTITNARAREVEESLPAYRTTLTVDHDFEPFNALLRVNYFDDAYESLFNDATLPIVTDGLFMVDAEISWSLDENFTLSIGAKNLLDEYPDEWETQGFTGRDGGFLGAIYPLNHPAGLGGGRYYLRVKADF